MMTGGAALAQTTGTVNPDPASTEPAGKTEVPPGGCMPIGLTASGEIVFPIQCKEFIDRERSKAAAEPNLPPGAGKPAMTDDKPAIAEQKPAAVEEKPVAAEQKPAAIAKPSTVEHNSAIVDEKPGQLEAVAPAEDATSAIGKPSDRPVEAAAVPKRASREVRKRAFRSDDCSHYRTYDRASGSYRGFDGRRHSC